MDGERVTSATGLNVTRESRLSSARRRLLVAGRCIRWLIRWGWINLHAVVTPTCVRGAVAAADIQCGQRIVLCCRGNGVNWTDKWIKPTPQSWLIQPEDKELYESEQNWLKWLSWIEPAESKLLHRSDWIKLTAPTELKWRKITNKAEMTDSNRLNQTKQNCLNWTVWKELTEKAILT